MDNQRRYLQLHNAAVGADIQHFATKLMGKIGDRLQMLMLVSQSLASSELARVEIFRHVSERHPRLHAPPLSRRLGLGRGQLAVVCQQLLKVLGPENVDFCEE